MFKNHCPHSSVYQAVRRPELFSALSNLASEIQRGVAGDRRLPAAVTFTACHTGAALLLTGNSHRKYSLADTPTGR